MLGRRWPAAVVVLGMVAAGGCATRHVTVTDGTAARTLAKMPAWYAAESRDSAWIVGRATALSADLQTALDIAKAEARADLVLQVEARTMAMTRRFREQTGAGADGVLLSQFTAVSRDVAAQTLRGVRVREREVQVEGGLFRAYVLLDLSASHAARTLLARLREDDALRTDTRAARAFAELANEVRRYDAAGDARADRDSRGAEPDEPQPPGAAPRG